MLSSTEPAEYATGPEMPLTGSPGNRRTAVIATLLVLAGVANNLRSLDWGFAYDDFAHQLFLRYPSQDSPPRPWNLYDFGPRPEPGDPFFEAGAFPWWTSPDFKIRFFRPVTSLTILLDFILYGNWAPGYHVTSLACYAVFLALAFRLYLAWGASGRAATWALAFLALEDAHVLPVAWIANRNTLLASLFSVATLLCVHHLRRKRKPLYFLLAVICLLLAYGSKESALALFPITTLYLLLYAGPSGIETAGQAVSRVMHSRTFWTFALLTAGYLAYYLAAGYGAHSVVYPAPWSDPLGYLSRLAILVPLGLLSLFFGFIPDVIPDYPQLIVPVVAGGVVLLAVTGVILFRAIRLTRLSGLASGWIVFALLTEAGGDVSDRLFMNASVGAALLIGLFLARLYPVRDQIAARQIPRVALAALLLLTGVLAAVPLTVLRDHVFRQLALGDTQAIVNAPIDLTAPPPRDVFLLNSPSSMLALSMSSTWSAYHDDRDTRIFPIQMCRRPLTWTRQDDRTMTLTSNGAPWCAGRFERLFCADRSTPPPGTSYETAAFTATIIDVDPAGIRSVRFQLRRSLDDASCFFLIWQNGRLTRIMPPPIGGTLHLPEAIPVVPYAP